MSIRRLPVHPNLDQLKHQAKDLFAAFRAGDPAAIAEFREHHPDKIDPASVKLADAQLVLARSYQASSWTRLVQAVELVDAIWDDNLETVRPWLYTTSICCTRMRSYARTATGVRR